MAVALTIAPFILLFLIFYRRLSCWRRAILDSAIVWGVLLTVMTEVLSIPRLLTLWSVSASWGIATIVLGWIYFQKKHLKYSFERKRSPIFLNLETLKSILPALLGIVLIAAVTGLIAIVAPPNTWDSMTYHMSRVVHWMQNQSVAHYPTAISRQLDLPPWSEFAIMHLQLLTGGDRLANLVQWFSMIGCVIGISLVAKQLGANVQGQGFAAVTCATIPMGILQASSTQNDYAISFWLVCFAFYFLLSLKISLNWGEFVLLGLSLGLACLTKATAYFYCLPFGFLLCISLFQRLKWKSLSPLILIGGLTLFLNVSHWWRNLALFGKPFGVSGAVVTNEKFGVSYFVANFIRNIGLHFPIFSQKFNDALESFIYSSYTWLFQADLNDPAITFWISKFYIPITPKTGKIFLHEDFSGNPIHLLLFLICLILFLVFLRKFSGRNILVSYSMAALGGVVLIALILKWTGFESRYHLPMFVLLSATAGVVLSRLLDNRVLQALALVLVLSSTPYLLFNVSRPLVLGNEHFIQFTLNSVLDAERDAQYFVNRPMLLNPYKSALNLIYSKQCYDIGLLYNVDSWEYPLWALTSPQDRRKLNTQHVNIASNASSRLSMIEPYKSFQPCALLGFETRSPNSEVVVQESVYRRAMSSDVIDVYLKK